jgi:hypothetical protein
MRGGSKWHYITRRVTIPALLCYCFCYNWGLYGVDTYLLCMEETRKVLPNRVGKSHGRVHLRDQGVDGKISECTVRKYVICAVTGFITEDEPGSIPRRLMQCLRSETCILEVFGSISVSLHAILT